MTATRDNAKIINSNGLIRLSMKDKGALLMSIKTATETLHQGG